MSHRKCPPNIPPCDECIAEARDAKLDQVPGCNCIPGQQSCAYCRGDKFRKYFEVLPKLLPYADAATDALAELAGAVGKWPRFNSLHEGWGVLSEEVDELWDHVRLNQKKRDPAAIRAEAIQVAAMALRIAVECTTEEVVRK